MNYIFIVVGMAIGIVIGLLINRGTIIGDFIMVGDEAFLELNDSESLKKASSKNYIRMRVRKRK